MHLFSIIMCTRDGWAGGRRQGACPREGAHPSIPVPGMPPHAPAHPRCSHLVNAQDNGRGTMRTRIRTPHARGLTNNPWPPPRAQGLSRKATLFALSRGNPDAGGIPREHVFVTGKARRGKTWVGDGRAPVGTTPQQHAPAREGAKRHRPVHPRVLHARK
jgi:hypothetical protein